MQRTLLSAADVRKIRELVKTTPRKNIAFDYNISTVQVWRIATGKAYTWVSDEVPDHAQYPDWKERDRLRVKRGDLQRFRKKAGEPLTVELWHALRERKGDRLPAIIVKEIRRLSQQNWPVCFIARRFNLLYHTVHAIVMGRTYLTVK